MDDRQRTLAAITIIVGFFALLLLLIAVIIGSRKIISPVPDDGAIRIIFISPTPPAGSVISSPTPTSAVIKVTPTGKKSD